MLMESVILNWDWVVRKSYPEIEIRIEMSVVKEWTLQLPGWSAHRHKSEQVQSSWDEEADI